jgi:hypothetical protein
VAVFASATATSAAEPDTACYGLRRMVLCTACAAVLQGQDYKREVPESVARAIRRGAA